MSLSALPPARPSASLASPAAGRRPSLDAWRGYCARIPGRFPSGVRRSVLGAHDRSTALIQLVFQDPYSSLNPRLSVRSVLRELLVANGLARGEGLERRCRELMSLVGLPIGALDGYPSSFSGGQRQRIAIARALAVEPQVIVADEPISALDVSVQAAVLALFTELRDELGIGIVLISHNLAAVRQVCDRVAVMYLGRVVEIGRRDDIFDDPRHPYTKALLAAAPRLRARGQGPASRLKESPRARRPGLAVVRSIPAAQGPSRYAATFCPRCYLPQPGATG